MRTLRWIALLSLCMDAPLFAATNGDEILDTWVTDSGESKVEIVKNEIPPAPLCQRGEFPNPHSRPLPRRACSHKL